MSYLLDTHALIWAINEPSKLSQNVKEIITNTSNNIFVSSVSFWEISLKYALGKLGLKNLKPEDFSTAAQSAGFTVIPLNSNECASYHHLTATHHKDPFDRMLIWIAINNNYTLISNDQNIKLYTMQGLQVIW